MKTRKVIVPAAVLLALPLVLYAPFLFGGRVLYWGIYLLQLYPWRQLAVEQIQAGHWPLWNPYLGAGTPLAANLQTAAFYPPNALFLLMPVERAFGWELALHVALAALSAYYLGRTLGLTRLGALIVGLAYGGGGYIISRWVFPSMVCAAAWLPLMLALTERLIRHASSKSRSPASRAGARIPYWILDIALLALVIALQLLAGHAQTSFYSAVITAAFALFRLAQQQTPIHESRIRASLLGLGSVLLSALWGIALAAIQLLPTAELTANSQRAGNLTDLTFAYELSFWPWRLITLLAPDFFGNPARDEYWAYGTYWEESGFIGVLPLILALAALAGWLKKRRREGKRETLAIMPFFFALALLSLILAMGDHTPLYPLLFRYLPGFGLFQAPARLMIGYALGMALLAGIGADTLRVTPRTRTTLRITVVAGLGMAIAGVAARIALPAVRASSGNSMLQLGLTLALASGVLLLQGRRLGKTRWQALVVALVLADLLAFGWGLAPSTDPSIYNTPMATAEFLAAQPTGRIYVDTTYAEETYNRYISLSTQGSSDAAHLQGLRESLLPNLNSIHELPGVGNYDPLTIGLYRDLDAILEERPEPLDDVRPVLNLFAARYVITDDELELPLLYGAGPRIYSNDQALPDAYVVHQARIIEDENSRLDALCDPGFDPWSEVLLSHSPPVTFPPSTARTTGEQPSISREGPDRVLIEAWLSAPGFLVLTDTYYPGWRATVDGEPVEILPANHAFRAVQVDRGKHTVVFEYAPLSFRLGAWITATSVLLLAAGLGIGTIRGRSRSIQNRRAP